MLLNSVVWLKCEMLEGPEGPAPKGLCRPGSSDTEEVFVNISEGSKIIFFRVRLTLVSARKTSALLS